MLQHMCEMGVTSVLPFNPTVNEVAENNSNSLAWCLTWLNTVLKLHTKQIGFSISGL